jgi:hypothetical protein
VWTAVGGDITVQTAAMLVFVDLWFRYKFIMRAACRHTQVVRARKGLARRQILGSNANSHCTVLFLLHSIKSLHLNRSLCESGS